MIRQYASRYWRLLIGAVCAVGVLLYFTSPRQDVHASVPSNWHAVPNVAMKGGLAAYWNVTDRSKGENGNDAQAQARGFKPVTILNTFSDYPGNQRQNIDDYLGKLAVNPWRKPSFFEPIIRRNIADAGTTGTFVHDIEFDFEEDVAKVWAMPDVRLASGKLEFAEFEEAYYREWASWFWQPALWAKKKYPSSSVGIYGPQPFRRDYWGVAGKDAKQIDGTHRSDARLWRYIDPHVDFYIASIYLFYPEPGSVFYMAANIEENYLRTRSYGNKPVYAYEWLRFHESNTAERNREVDDYLAEAMAIVPYFSGARAVVLWGYEPHVTAGNVRLYATLPTFAKALARVAAISDALGRGKLELDEPAHVLWNRKVPLVRKVMVTPAECVVMAINPWQREGSVSQADVTCGGTSYAVPMNGRHTSIAHIKQGTMIRH